MLRLCNFSYCDVSKIRALIGMCETHFIWKHHPHFIKYIRDKFIGGSSFQIKHTSLGKRCKFTLPDNFQTVFLNTKISKGVFRWTVKVNFETVGGMYEPNLTIGAATSTSLSNRSGGRLGSPNSDSWGFKFSGYRNMSFFSELSNVEQLMCISMPFVFERSLVSIEADSGNHTLVFFVNEKKATNGVANVPEPLYFGITGFSGPAFTSVAFCRLSVPSLAAVPCTFFPAVHADCGRTPVEAG